MSTPTVSVVAAAHNRATRLETLLRALEGQTLPLDDFEVVIVDDGSSDRTPEVLAEAVARGLLRLRTLRQEPAQGPAVARNAGWRAAEGSIIAFTDDDCRPEPNWLAALIAPLTGREDRIVQGRTEPDPLEAENLGPFAKTVTVDGPTPHYETCNIAYPRALLEQLGGFDEGFPAPAGEDSDLGWRALDAGATALFAPDALTYHAVHVLGPKGTLKNVLYATDGVQAYKLNPRLRPWLVQRVFYRRSHPLLLQALLAAALTRRTPAAALFSLPYLANVLGRIRASGGSPALLPFFVLLDMVEVGATVRGAIRHRMPVL